MKKQLIIILLGSAMCGVVSAKYTVKEAKHATAMQGLPSKQREMERQRLVKRLEREQEKERLSLGKRAERGLAQAQQYGRTAAQKTKQFFTQTVPEKYYQVKQAVKKEFRTGPTQQTYRTK